MADQKKKGLGAASRAVLLRFTEAALRNPACVDKDGKVDGKQAAFAALIAYKAHLDHLLNSVGG